MSRPIRRRCLLLRPAPRFIAGSLVLLAAAVGCSREKQPAVSAPAGAASGTSSDEVQPPGGSLPAIESVERFTGYALRFAESDTLEIENSRDLLDGARPFTIELWVRMYPGDQQYAILGNQDSGRGKPTTGWRLERRDARGESSWQWSGLTHRAAPREYAWQHIALCGNGAEATLFVDGAPVSQGPCRELSSASSPLNLVLGSLPQDDRTRAVDPAPSRSSWRMDVRLVRVSSGARYNKAFTPAPAFTSDEHTLCLLDFSQPSDSASPDRSGKGRNGINRGATWIELPGPAPKVSSGPLALRMAGGDFIEIPRIEGITLNANFTAEMWCRFDADRKEADWMGALTSVDPAPGSWSLRAVRAGEATQLTLLAVDGNGEWVQSSPFAVPAGKAWRHVAVCGSEEQYARVFVDGKLALVLRHSVDRGRAPQPAGMFLGAPWAAPDAGTLEVQGLRVSFPFSYPGDATGFRPPVLVEQPETQVLIDFSQASLFAARDLSPLANHGRLGGGAWVDPQSGERFAVAAGITNGGAGASGPLVPSSTMWSTIEIHESKDDSLPSVSLSQLAAAGMHQDLFAHEILRQAMLMTLRDEFGLAAFDGALGETAGADEPPAAQLVLETSIAPGAAAQARLFRLTSSRREAIWQAECEIPGSPVLAYRRLVEQAELWTRSEMPDALRRAGLRAADVPAANDALLPDALEERLWRMDFVEQYSALRATHRLLREQGPSQELYGALARGYANLGMLTEFQWNHAHKALKARAVLYAQRLADSGSNKTMRRHRAYAWAMAGLHKLALDDLSAAGSDAADSPPWLRMLDAYCRFDADAIQAASQDTRCEAMGLILRYLASEDPASPTLSWRRAADVLGAEPACMRVLDGMYDIELLGNLHLVTEFAPSIWSRSLYRNLPDISDLPGDVSGILSAAERAPPDVRQLARLLREAPDPGLRGLSFRALAYLIEETQFVHVWNRAAFMRFRWSVPVDEFLAEESPSLADHPQHPLLEMITRDEAAIRQVLSAHLEQLEPPLPLSAGNRIWRLVLPNFSQGRQASRFPPTDEMYREVAALFYQARPYQTAELSARLTATSPFFPRAIAWRITSGDPPSKEEMTRLESDFGRHPAVLDALANLPAAGNDAERLLRKRIELSPDYGAFHRLAKLRLAVGDVPGWKRALEDFLDQPDVGLAHAQARVDLARHYMERGEWEQARPYAEAAAQTYAEWAMRTAVECYVGLGDLDQAELWMQRIAERYGHVAEYQDWLARHGRKPPPPPDGRLRI